MLNSSVWTMQNNDIDNEMLITNLMQVYINFSLLIECASYCTMQAYAI